MNFIFYEEDKISKEILTISGLLAGYADVVTAKKKTVTRMHNTKFHAVNFITNIVNDNKIFF